jgi:predicted ester cyclase
MTSVDPSHRPDDAVLREVARAVEEGFKRQDPQRIAAVFTETAVVDDPGAQEGVLRGRAAIQEYFASYLRAFPDAELQQEALFAPLDGNEYATRWRVRGTMRGDLVPPGFAATGRRVETEGVAVIELSGSLVSRCRQFYDTTQVGRQLGAAPPRGSRLERAGVLAQRMSVAVRARMRRA